MLDNPAGLVYGTLIVGALLDAESVANESYGETVAAVLAAMALAWLSHSYADYVGQRLQQRAKFRMRELVSALYRGLGVLVGAVVPLLTILVCWAVRASLSTGVTISIYDSAAVLLVIEFAAGIRAHLSGTRLLVQSLFGALLGGLIIVLKLILH
jgi:hypothetical protein